MKTVEIPEVMTDPQRPGILTTEFWLTVLGVVLTFLVNVHVITAADAGFIGAALVAAVALVIKLCVIGALVSHYVHARLDVKLGPPPSWPSASVALTPEGAQRILKKLREDPAGTAGPPAMRDPRGKPGPMKAPTAPHAPGHDPVVQRPGTPGDETP